VPDIARLFPIRIQGVKWIHAALCPFRIARMARISQAKYEIRFGF
jgi:hypothetical protein